MVVIILQASFGKVTFYEKEILVLLLVLVLCLSVVAKMNNLHKFASWLLACKVACYRLPEWAFFTSFGGKATIVFGHFNKSTSHQNATVSFLVEVIEVGGPGCVGSVCCPHSNTDLKTTLIYLKVDINLQRESYEGFDI